VTLAGQRAIVTGATRGIGAAIARALDTHGVRTLLVARDRDSLAVMAAALQYATPLPEDLAEPSAAVRVADGAPRLLDGPVDILVNNAGVFDLAPIHETDDALIDASLAINLAAPFRLMRALIPAMRARTAGHIVTIGSIADHMALPGNGAYAASKFGVRGLHEVARVELRGTGVRTTLVSPGPTDTPTWDPHDPDVHPDLPPRAAMLRAEQVADAVVWALSQPPDVNVDELRLSHS
jgi:NADP-dependent 3-hydroxy acid dehydrogenase YdfG